VFCEGQSGAAAFFPVQPAPIANASCGLKAALPRFAHEKALTPSRYLFAKSYEYDLCLQARRWAELGLTKSGHGIRFCQVFLI